MTRKDVDYLVIAAMLVSGLYVTLSGLVADLFGLHQFALHSQAGYVCAALGVFHLALNWRRVRAYLGRRISSARTAASPRQRASHPQGRGLAEGTLRRQLLLSGLSAAGGFLLGRLIPGRRRTESPYETADVGELYHQWSKPGGSASPWAVLDWGERPGRVKLYPDAERISLPDPLGYQGLRLEEALVERRSVRDYAAESLSMEELSRLLHAAQGVTADREGFRAAPSAGALYPIELYPVVHDVVGLAPGIYHYAVAEHELELLRAEDLRAAVTRAGLWQGFLGQAGACFVLSAIFQRTRWRYRERTYRYVLLEAGHVAQNLYLAATSLGLGACAVGAFLDDELNQLLEVDGREEAALYIVSVGKVGSIRR